MSLQRLVLTFKPEAVEIRVLYRTRSGPNPGTKARAREITQLARTGLEQVLETLREPQRVDVVGESGYEVREDVIAAKGKDGA